MSSINSNRDTLVIGVDHATGNDLSAVCIARLLENGEVEVLFIGEAKDIRLHESEDYLPFPALPAPTPLKRRPEASRRQQWADMRALHGRKR